MKKYFFFLSMLLTVNILFAQQKPAYVLYDADGKKVSYKKMMKQLAKKDIVLFGEFHNNPISHWLELTVAKDLKEKRELIFGAEMFEADNQPALNNYLEGRITAKGLDSTARLWNNYKTDYAPIVNFAKEIKAPFIATNIPRRYASLVSKKGFEALDTLPAKEKAWMAPLPMDYDSTLPGYVNMLKMMGGHASANMPKAQASKDATMAYFILQNFKPGALFIHYNGAYHSDNFDGINWYLKKKKPELNIATISTVSQKNIKALLAENKGKADFIICVDEDMTTTY
ncbi:MAG: ChaN family lipoprotein [Ferruginibacter sp.]|nr:ChaN family lipoprotein [Chitinophagaceae bacterium]MBP6286017.1 ChaN family lipoprotein [Ferruginibacter sp.]MBU9935094.1 ChaN family lipoprotein [Ferruginibacter sp.]HQY11686.1 ChaN family lipoprotein [Ferruginibacter sp.]